MITPPNALKERVGSGFGIDPELAKRAEGAVKNLQEGFAQRLTGSVAGIVEQIELAEQNSPDDRCAAEIVRIAQDLQMQGDAYEYPLVTEICKSLCGYVGSLAAPADLSVVVVRAHTDALQSVIGNDIKTDGGRVGQDLLDSLGILVAKSIG